MFLKNHYGLCSIITNSITWFIFYNLIFDFSFVHTSFCIVIKKSRRTIKSNVEFILISGSGVFLGYTGMYVLLLEYAATKYRALVNTAILMLWAVGYLLVTFTGYMIHE